MPHSFSFRGVEIEVNHRGHFIAHAGGKYLTSSSLDGIRKQIKAASEFKSFPCIYQRHSEFRSGMVVGLGKGRYGMHFIVEDREKYKGSVELSSVLPDTPAMHRLVAAYQATKSANEARIAKLKAEIEGAAAKLVPIRVEDGEEV